MNYIVDINGRRISVEIDGDRVRVDGRPVQASLTMIEGTPIHVLRVGDAVHRIVARRTARGRYVLSVDGWRLDAEALDERTRAIRELSAANAGPSGPAPLVAPMPGLVVRVSVAVGDSVQPGQGLVVMEAMKMENELRSAATGTVKAIRAQPGDAVEKGAVLVELQ